LDTIANPNPAVVFSGAVINLVILVDVASENSKMGRMKNSSLGFLALALVSLGVLPTTASAQAAARPPASISDEPELAQFGAFAIGTNVIEFDLGDRPKITAIGAALGRLPNENRKLSVRFWYPAASQSQGVQASYRFVFKRPGKPDFDIVTPGRAREGATAITGQRFPFVLISHGYRGWASNYSQLAETLASKGYVVAAIDHNDANFDSTLSFQLSFGNVILDRAQDQRDVLARIVAQATSASNGPLSVVDGGQIGVIGYSMGGFGALATAGAPYDPSSRTISQMPASAQRILSQPRPATDVPIKALVAMAPWGAQPENRSWNSEGIAQIKVPTLLISGDHDDVVNYREGVRWLFDNLKGSERYLLVYQNARHNIAGNDVELPANADFTTREYFYEPVWRTQRINQINAHFISAFLDTTLKGEVGKRAYLNVPTSNAGEGAWPVPPGAQLGGSYAGAEQGQYWRGFQRRWALGLEMHHSEKGEATAR
jgi:predicted dienelactone hydrolase